MITNLLISFLISVSILSCQTGTLTLHNNFESVFYYFPDRLDDSVHGYVATFSCDDIGKKGFLVVGDKVVKVKVADCLAQKDKESNPEHYKGWITDVDEFLYYGLRIKNHKNRGTLCLINNTKNQK